MEPRSGRRNFVATKHGFYDVDDLIDIVEAGLVGDDRPFSQRRVVDDVGAVVELELVPEPVADGVVTLGVGMPNFERFETLGWAAPAGPFENAPRMFSVTLTTRHSTLVLGPFGQIASTVGDHPNVPAEKTPAPLGAEYHVELAHEVSVLQVTGEWAMTWMLAGVGTP